jgi:hypothetical protein
MNGSTSAKNNTPPQTTTLSMNADQIVDADDDLAHLMNLPKAPELRRVAGKLPGQSFNSLRESTTPTREQPWRSS